MSSDLFLPAGCIRWTVDVLRSIISEAGQSAGLSANTPSLLKHSRSRSGSLPLSPSILRCGRRYDRRQVDGALEPSLRSGRQLAYADQLTPRDLEDAR